LPQFKFSLKVFESLKLLIQKPCLNSENSFYSPSLNSARWPWQPDLIFPWNCHHADQAARPFSPLAGPLSPVAAIPFLQLSPKPRPLPGTPPHRVPLCVAIRRARVAELVHRVTAFSSPTKTTLSRLLFPRFNSETIELIFTLPADLFLFPAAPTRHHTSVIHSIAMCPI
jgi:hypothetical protein